MITNPADCLFIYLFMVPGRVLVFTSQKREVVRCDHFYPLFLPTKKKAPFFF